MDPSYDVDLSILGLTEQQCSDIWRRLNIVARSYGSDGYTVTLSTTSYPPEPEDDEDNE